MLDTSGSMAWSLSDNNFPANLQDSRIEQAKLVIKKIVSDSDFVQSANFGFIEWNSAKTDNVSEYNCNYYSPQYKVRKPSPPWTIKTCFEKLVVPVSVSGASSIYSAMDALLPGGGTKLDSAMTLASAYLTGPQSPINSSLGCQKTILIVISDGDWEDVNASNIAASLLAKGVKTYVVGFGSDVANQANYKTLSIKGGTYPVSPFFAQNYQQLYDQLSQAIRAETNLVNAGVTPIFSTVAGVDAVYIPSFLVRNFHQWEGSLIKKSLSADGSIGAQQWDAAQLLNGMGDSQRRVWTASNLLPSSKNNFITDNAQVLGSILYGNAGYVPTNSQVVSLIGFVRGLDAYNEFGGSRWKLADIYHSQLKLVGPPSDYVSISSSDQNYESYYRGVNGYGQFKSNLSSRNNVIYVGANDGMLHAFNESSGAELWAFIPPPMLNKLHKMENESTTGKSNSIYGVDGSPEIKDVYFSGAWHTVLFCGLGSGGKAYFALDITNPDAPTHLFSFENDPASGYVYYWSATGSKLAYPYTQLDGNNAIDFRKLGDAWSKPATLLMPFDHSQRWVFLIGGGYGGSAKTGYGSAVYVLDVATGQILNRIDLADDPASDIGNGVLPRISLIKGDQSSSGYKGAIAYFVDTQGKLWKINLTNNGSLYYTEQVFNAQATYANDRLSFHALSSSFGVDSSGKLGLYHFFGTANNFDLQRVDDAIQNRIYGIEDKDFPLPSNLDGSYPFDIKKLQNVGSALTGQQCPLPSQNGWYANLADIKNQDGSLIGKNYKVTGEASVYNSSVFFPIYQPDAANLCAVGSGKLVSQYTVCGNGRTVASLGKGIPVGISFFKGKSYVSLTATEKDVVIKTDSVNNKRSKLIKSKIRVH